MAEDLIQRMSSLADDLDGPLECRWPAYGVPGHSHCAACCYGTGRIITCAEDQAMADAADALRAAVALLKPVVATLKPASHSARTVAALTDLADDVVEL